MIVRGWSRSPRRCLNVRTGRSAPPRRILIRTRRSCEGSCPRHIYGGDVRDPATSVYATAACWRGLVSTADAFQRSGRRSYRSRQSDCSRKRIRFIGESTKSSATRYFAMTLRRSFHSHWNCRHSMERTRGHTIGSQHLGWEITGTCSLHHFLSCDTACKQIRRGRTTGFSISPKRAVGCGPDCRDFMTASMPPTRSEISVT